MMRKRRRKKSNNQAPLQVLEPRLQIMILTSSYATSKAAGIKYGRRCISNLINVNSQYPLKKQTIQKGNGPDERLIRYSKNLSLPENLKKKDERMKMNKSKKVLALRAIDDFLVRRKTEQLCNHSSILKFRTCQRIERKKRSNERMEMNKSKKVLTLSTMD